MTQRCLNCKMKGFNIKVAYFVCFGIILFCLSVAPAQESFSVRQVRAKINKARRRMRREKDYHKKNIESMLSRLKRRFL